MAELFDDGLLVLFGNGGQLEVGAVFAEQVQTREPLFDAVIPVWQQEAAGADFLGQQAGGGIGGRGINPFGGQGQVAEAQQFGGEHAFLLGIKFHFHLALDILGE